MQRFLLAVLASFLILGGAIGADAAGMPWKEDDAKDDSSTGPVDLKAELDKVAYSRLVKPIEAKVQAAEKAMELHDKEMQKPVDKRNPRLLLACKERAATFYVGASLAAKQAANRHRDERIKNAIKEQFQKPNDQKAIDIYLELAMKAQEANDMRRAVAYYRRILQIDKGNDQAKEALTQIAKQLQENARTGKGGRSTGGGGSEDEPKDRWKRDDDEDFKDQYKKKRW